MAQLSIDPKQSEIFNRLSQLGTEAFNTYYEQIGSPAMSASELGNLKNAFGHAYSSAWLAGRVGKAGSGSHLHKFSSYKCYIFKSSILNLNH